MQRITFICVLILLPAMTTRSTFAQLEIDWFTIDGGGGMNSTGGTLDESGTAGQPDAGMTMTGGTLELSDGFWTVALPAAVSVNIEAANPPTANPYGSGVFRDVLQNTTTALAPQGIGVAGTPAEGPYSYATISVAFSDTPVPAPTPSNITVSCTSGTCPTVTGVSGSAAGPYTLTLSGGIPVLQCTTFTFAGTNAGQKLQYQNLPGDADLSGSTTAQDALTLATAISNGTASLPGNLARYDTNRSGTVNLQDLLRLAQLLNGVKSTQVFNGATVAACP